MFFQSQKNTMDKVLFFNPSLNFEMFQKISKLDENIDALSKLLLFWDFC